MKIVVIGGSGLIGKKLVSNLRQQRHEVLAASPSTGVNAVTGEGLAEALNGAQVVVDVANAPSWEDKAVLEFFETSGRNLLAAETAAGVKHHVALSVVGTDRLLASGYFRAKMAQEKLRYKAAFHPILFELLPEKFTLPQLYNLYTGVYDTVLDKRNFTRKILSTKLLIKQKEKEKEGSKKGAFYYKLDKRRYDSAFHSFLNFIPNPDNLK